MTDRKILFCVLFWHLLAGVGFAADAASRADLARRLDELPLAAVWLGGSLGTDLSLPSDLLNASSTFLAGASITNIWRDPAQARSILGPSSFLAPGQKVILETDPGTARTIGRNGLKYYLTLRTT